MASFRAADRYAKSLLELAQEQNSLEAVHSDMEHIRASLTASKPLKLMLSSPVVGQDIKERALKAVFPSLGVLSQSFVDIILRKGREAYLPQIVQAFHYQYMALKNIARASVVSAQPLSPELESALREKLRTELGQQVELSQSVDPSLIGGFVLNIGDRQVDTSIAHQLAELHQELITDDYVPQI